MAGAYPDISAPPTPALPPRNTPPRVSQLPPASLFLRTTKMEPASEPHHHDGACLEDVLDDAEEQVTAVKKEKQVPKRLGVTLRRPQSGAPEKASATGSTSAGAKHRIAVKTSGAKSTRPDPTKNSGKTKTNNSKAKGKGKQNNNKGRQGEQTERKRPEKKSKSAQYWKGAKVDEAQVWAELDQQAADGDEEHAFEVEPALYGDEVDGEDGEEMENLDDMPGEMEEPHECFPPKLFASSDGQLLKGSGLQHILGTSYCVHPWCCNVSTMEPRTEPSVGFCCHKCYERLVMYQSKKAKEHGKYFEHKKYKGPNPRD